MLYRRTISADLETTVERLRASIAEHKFGVLGEIDLAAKMNEKGVAFDQPCLILEVCNPNQAKRVLERNMAIATALPCRICVYGEKGNVTVATLKPRQLIGLYEDSQALQAVAGEVEDALVAIIDAACAQAGA